MPSFDLLCGFCCKPLPLPRQADRLAARAGQVHLCRHCGTAYLVASERVNPRSAIAGALHLAGPRLQLTTSASIADVQGQPLFLVCGWDPDEMLSTVRAAQILDLHRATVQQHVRDGRFPGALLSQAVSRGGRGFWNIPRRALALYLREKGKAAALGHLKSQP